MVNSIFGRTRTQMSSRCPWVTQHVTRVRRLLSPSNVNTATCVCSTIHISMYVRRVLLSAGRLTGRFTWCSSRSRSMERAMCSVAEFQDELKRLGLETEAGPGIRLDKDEDKGLAVITMDNPDRKNAFNGSMIVELGRILDDLERWEEGKGVILWGGPHIFCSGADLHMIHKLSGSGESGVKLASVMHHLLHRLLTLPLLSVALVTGKALGGGGELLTACDFRLMASDAEIQFLHQRMGLITGWGGGTRLVRLLGRTPALDLLTSCRRVSAEEALRLGLADEVLSPGGEASLDECKRWLTRRTAGATSVVRAMKSMVSGAAEASSYQDALRVEREVFAGVWGGPAQLQAIAKFYQK